MIELTKLQKEIMEEFYSIQPTKIIFTKKERNKIWKQAKSRDIDIDFSILEKKCPALCHQIKKSYEYGKNIQSAVFSECVYAQTFANMLNLNIFVNCLENSSFLSDKIKNFLSSYNLYPRYAYSNKEKTRLLIQAGGCNGIDSALISVIDFNIFTLEFKEAKAKASEPDLPKYKEDGKLLVTKDFLQKYPQFSEMLAEQKDLNFFEVMGNNIHNFSNESVNIAVSNNYTKKYADVICTEDKKGYLVMLPVNQVSLWADIEGEIRPAGRNHYKVWTPNALNLFLQQKEAKFIGNTVTIYLDKLELRKERGGNGKVSGYKINPLFFVYLENCIKKDNQVTFEIKDVRQLNPTIAGKMFFKDLNYSKVKAYYKM